MAEFPFPVSTSGRISHSVLHNAVPTSALRTRISLVIDSDALILIDLDSTKQPSEGTLRFHLMHLR